MITFFFGAASIKSSHKKCDEPPPAWPGAGRDLGPPAAEEDAAEVDALHPQGPGTRLLASGESGSGVLGVSLFSGRQGFLPLPLRI